MSTVHGMAKWLFPTVKIIKTEHRNKSAGWFSLKQWDYIHYIYKIKCMKFSSNQALIFFEFWKNFWVPLIYISLDLFPLFWSMIDQSYKCFYFFFPKYTILVVEFFSILVKLYHSLPRVQNLAPWLHYITWL